MLCKFSGFTGHKFYDMNYQLNKMLNAQSLFRSKSNKWYNFELFVEFKYGKCHNKVCLTGKIFFMRKLLKYDL